MNIKVDRENDAIYFRVDEKRIVESEEVRPGVVLDFDENDQVVGVGFLGISARASGSRDSRFSSVSRGQFEPNIFSVVASKGRNMHEKMNAGMIRTYRAIVADKGDGLTHLLVPTDFNRHYLRTIEFLVGKKELHVDELETREWEAKAKEMLPELEAPLTRVTYRVAPSFQPARKLEVAIDKRRGVFRRKTSVEGQEAGPFCDVDDQEQLEDSIIAMLKSSLPLSLGHVLGCDGTSYTLAIEQGFNRVEISWWCGIADLPDSILRLTGLLDKWILC
jgi:uncharacterized protein YuzE